MRKQLLSLSLVAVAGTAFAQTTITAADQAPMLSVFNQANDTMPTVTPGNSGTSQTYNLAALNNHTEDSLTFTNPQWTQNAADYPNSNLTIMVNQGDAYIYAMINSSILEVHGQAADVFGNGIIALTFQNPETQMIFPAAYGSSFVDTAGGVQQFYLGYDPGIGFTVDSVRIHTTIHKDSEYDGWGSATTPLGTYSVLRQNTYRVQNDTIDIYAFGAWVPGAYTQETIDRTYSFWTNGIGFPVAELVDDGDQGMISSATWLVSNPTVTGIPVTENNNTVIAYPNPASDVLNIQTTAAEGNIEIVDMTGRVVKTAVINSTTTQIDVTDLASGMYTYRVNGVTEGKVQVAH